jgi:hypothetical protein
MSPTKETTSVGVGTKQSKILLKKKLTSKMMEIIMSIYGTFSLKRTIRLNWRRKQPK